MKTILPSRNHPNWKALINNELDVKLNNFFLQMKVKQLQQLVKMEELNEDEAIEQLVCIFEVNAENKNALEDLSHIFPDLNIEPKEAIEKTHSSSENKRHKDTTKEKNISEKQPAKTSLTPSTPKHEPPKKTIKAQKNSPATPVSSETKTATTNITQTKSISGNKPQPVENSIHPDTVPNKTQTPADEKPEFPELDKKQAETKEEAKLIEQYNQYKENYEEIIKEIQWHQNYLARLEEEKKAIIHELEIITNAILTGHLPYKKRKKSFWKRLFGSSDQEEIQQNNNEQPKTHEV